MKYLVLPLFGFILMAQFISCNHNSSLTPTAPVDSSKPVPGPGQFGLSHLKGLGKTSGSTMEQSGQNLSFDLGAIRGSSVFYFLLYNIGSKPITNVMLSVHDTNFSVYPATIDTLVPGGDLEVLPVIKISAYHGTALDGPGYRPLMPMGDNKADVMIVGKTQTASGSDTIVSLTAGLDLKALVMDIDMPQISLDTSSWILNGTFPERNNTVSTYNAPGCSVVVRNTGNVPIILRAYYKLNNDQVYVYFDTATYIIEIDQNLEIPRLNSDIYFSLDGNNTATNTKRLPPAPNGRCYLYLNHGSTHCQSSTDTLLDLSTFNSLIANQSGQWTDAANRLFLIDSAMVFWELIGYCPGGMGMAPDHFYRLYGKTVNAQLGSCMIYDHDPMGPIESYVNQNAHDLLDTIRANLSKPDLGLGSGHVVEQIPLN
jgi:hypothetical protein